MEKKNTDGLQQELMDSPDLEQFLSQNQEQTLELERAKGKLVIFCRNFPTEVAQMSLKLSPVY